MGIEEDIKKHGDLLKEIENKSNRIHPEAVNELKQTEEKFHRAQNLVRERIDDVRNRVSVSSFQSQLAL